jgi:putative membrane protein
VSLGRALAAFAGLAVLAWLVWEIGAGVLMASLSELSWRLPLVLAPYALVAALDAAGWRYAFPGSMPPVPLLAAARLAGEAVNLATPTATLGGEPVKAWLLARRRVPLDEALVSVVVAKTALVVSHLVFVAAAVAVAAGQAAASAAFLGVMGGLTAAGTIAVGGFILTQQRGLFGASGRALSWAGIGGLTPHLVRLDAGLSRYYRQRRARFAAAVAWHLLGWIAGGLEVWLAVRLLGAPISLGTAVFIEAFGTAIRAAAFLVPAGLGLQEGGLVAIFAAFGLDAGTGLAFGLVRRLREAAWAVAGFGILAAWPRDAEAPGGTDHRTPGGDGGRSHS